MEVLLVTLFLLLALLICAVVFRPVVRQRIFYQLSEIKGRYDYNIIEAVRANDAVYLLRLQRSREKEIKEVKMPWRENASN